MMQDLISREKKCMQFICELGRDDSLILCAAAHLMHVIINKIFTRNKFL